MSEKSECQQLLYGWSGSGTRKGYQTIAVTPGTPRKDIEYMDLHPLPVSFSPGEMESCTRRYTLPSGNIAYSFVKSSGTDELGREGAYYVHFIIVPRRKHDTPSVDVSNLMDNFTRESEVASLILKKFESRVLDFPTLSIQLQDDGHIPDVSSYFASPSDLGWYIFSLSDSRYSIIHVVPRGRTAEQAMQDISEMTAVLPPEFQDASMTTYSKNFSVERSIFRIFFLEGSENSHSPGADGMLLFENGTLRTRLGTHLPMEFQEIGRLILSRDWKSLQEFSRFYSTLPGGHNIVLKMRYSCNEYMYNRSKNVDLAVFLFQHALTDERARYYAAELKQLISNAEDFRKVTRVFLDRISGADRGEVAQILRDSLSILEDAPSPQDLKEYLEKAVDIFRENKDQFPYVSVFKSLSSKEYTPTDSLAIFLANDRKMCNTYVDEFLSVREHYNGFVQIGKIIEEISDKKQVRKLILRAYGTAISAYDIQTKLDFLDDYTKTKDTDLDTASDIFIRLSKEIRSMAHNDYSGRMREIFQRLKDLGLPEKEANKLSKLVDSIFPLPQSDDA